MFLTNDVNSIKSKKINKILGDLTGGENSKILYFIDVINKYINDENYKIDGYRNRRDQNEIAVVDLSSVIDGGSIVKGKFEKIVIANPNVITFPFSQKKQISIPIPSYNEGTWDPRQSRATCPYDILKEYRDASGTLIRSELVKKALYTLYYKWENEANSKIFRCLKDQSVGDIEDDAPQFVNEV
jgi:hypothetical protein